MRNVAILQIGKMISIQQAAITRKDIKVTCPYCKKSDFEESHVCKVSGDYID